jgi:hypothetical protein
LGNDVPFDVQISNPIIHLTVTAHRIVPVRFARAVSGFSDRKAPDLDDHGFTIPASFCSAHGPVIGVIQGETVRVKVIRDHLEPTAQLFPSVDDSSAVGLEFPLEGNHLDPVDKPAVVVDDTEIAAARQGDCMYVHGEATGSADVETKLKIHFNSLSGPVMAEIAVRVYQPLIIRVQPHAVSINGVGPTTGLGAVQSLFRRVNHIYAQAGVRFVVNGSMMPEVVGSPAGAAFTTAGTVTLTNVADERNTELQTVLRGHPVGNALNAYFFAHYFDTVSGLQDQVLGIAFSRDKARSNPPNPATGFPGCQAGITVRDSADPIEAAHTIAHEIGHALRLEHYALGNGSAGVAGDQREDIWAHRCLMFNIVGLSATAPAGNRYPSSSARIQVGYGNLANGFPSTGQLLTTKRRSKILQSDQIQVLRQAWRAGSYKPI